MNLCILVYLILLKYEEKCITVISNLDQFTGVKAYFNNNIMIDSNIFNLNAYLISLLNKEKTLQVRKIYIIINLKKAWL